MPYGESEVTKIGNGQIDIKREKTKQSSTSFYGGGFDPSYLGKAWYQKRESSIIQFSANLFTVTASDVMPLLKGSHTQPLGITISRSEQKRNK